MEGKQRVRNVNEQTVQIDEEGHTMMNPLRWCISRNFGGETVELSGYTIPHPSDNASNLTIQFRDEAVQNQKNVLNKVVEGLECMDAIGRKMLMEVERFEDGSG